MKHVSLLIALYLSLAISTSTHAQVTNLIVNGVSANFTMTSGDTLSWSYIVPVGTTTLLEIWLDVNLNGSIDSASDVMLVTANQTDGDTIGNNGPPDMDGLRNGHAALMMPVGLMPGTFVMRFTNNNASATIAGTITHLPSPAFTISGHVTPPAGKSAQYILVEISREGGGTPDFWDAYTDVSGNYTIEMNADTAGNPWRASLQTQFPPNIPMPVETLITITANITGLNFRYVAPAAQVAGYLLDENNVPLGDHRIELYSYPFYYSYSARTNLSGFFQIGIPAEALLGQSWTIHSSTSGQFTTTRMRARADIPIINPNDSLFRVLKAYSTNAQIRGKVQWDMPITSLPFYVAAQSDSGEATTLSDSLTGNFTLWVSDKIYNYSLALWNIPGNWNYSQVLAHPGDTGIVINVTSTAVIERQPGIPNQFALEQNYPNPFNPMTTFEFALPKSSYVTLKIFNLLGEEVATPVSQELSAGTYKIRWDASGVASGVYLYRFSADDFVQTRKLILLR